MRVRHLRCATLCPPGGGWLLGETGTMVCHCLLIETDRDGLVLVDTALSRGDLAARARNYGLGASLFFGLRPGADAASALEQVRGLGYRAEDVRHVVLTHLDIDHAGGLGDFPGAKVHVHEPEYAAAQARGWLVERLRYHPHQWAHVAPEAWVRYEATEAGEPWFGFVGVQAVRGAGGGSEILLVPLAGHSAGHCGVAVRAGGGWLLHCGDAYFDAGEMDPAGRRCPIGLEVFQRLMQWSGARRRENQERLRALVRDRGAEVRAFCAHDPSEFERLAKPGVECGPPLGNA